MKAAWIVSASLAGGIHAWLLFAVHPGTAARALEAGDDSAAVELSVVEAAPGEPARVATPSQPPEAPEPPAPPPEPTPPARVEPVMSEEPQPSATPPPRPAPKPRAAAPTRAAAAPATAGAAPGSGASGTGGGRAGGATTKARYRSNPRPDYPAEARRAGQQGTVMLAVEVTADGRAGSVRLSQSSGFPVLDAAALQAVRRWTFDPARNLGMAVASQVEVPVRFDLRQR